MIENRWGPVFTLGVRVVLQASAAGCTGRASWEEAREKAQRKPQVFVRQRNNTEMIYAMPCPLCVSGAPFLEPLNHTKPFYHYCVYLSDTCTCKTGVPDKAYLIRHAFRYTKRISLCAWTCCRLARKTLHLTSSLSLCITGIPLHYWRLRIVADMTGVSQMNSCPDVSPLALLLLLGGDSVRGKDEEEYMAWGEK